MKPIDFSLANLDAGEESLPVFRVILASLEVGSLPRTTGKVSNEYCGEWSRFEFKKSFKFQTLHLNVSLKKKTHSKF